MKSGPYARVVKFVDSKQTAKQWLRLFYNFAREDSQPGPESFTANLGTRAPPFRLIHQKLPLHIIMIII
jgi:hypothetical protein